MAARGYRASGGGRTYTFDLRRDIRFADGTPMTAADVVFSFRRLINLKGNPAFLLSGVTPSARGRYTVVLRSRTPNTAIPSIVANTSLGIVNSKLARRHGATDGPNAARTDKAERWFNSPASVGAGSGPYVLRQYSTTSQIVARAEPALLAGEARVRAGRDPEHGRGDAVHQRSSGAGTRSRSTSPRSRRKGCGGTAVSACGRSRRRGCSGCSPTTTRRSRPRPRTSASRTPFGTLDYPSFVRLAGPGAIQAGGSSPRCSSARCRRRLPQRNLTRARSELAASGVGGQTFTLEYPSDLTINGVAFATLAQRVQANLQDIGIKVELAGAPVGTWLDKYRGGTMAFGLSLWGPDYPDPADYLAFMPGELVGVRVGWPKGGDPALERLAATARVTTSDRAGRRSTVRSSAG